MKSTGGRAAATRLVSACALVLCVLAMQTLGVHCAPAHAAAATGSHAHAASPAEHFDAVVADAAPESAVVLCAQMLLGAAGAALLLLALRRSGCCWTVLLRVRAAGVSPRTAGAGPPYVWRYSVIRR